MAQPPAVPPPQQTYWTQPADATVQTGLGAGNAIAGVVLVLFGLLMALVGVLFLVGGSIIGNVPTDTTEGANMLDAIRGAIGGLGIVILVYGILEFISGLGIFMRKNWARLLGITLSILPFLFGLLALVSSFSLSSSTDPEIRAGFTSSLVTALVLVIAYGFTIIALARGGASFRRG